MTVKVSVVVPVYNPGRYFDRCVESVLGQSLAPDEYEAVFVDDGSTDGTPDRLDALAARHPNVRVIHQANSGWPGKPRNVGVDAAQGDYVFFADDDDALGPEALQRLWAMAVRNGADIVVGKMVGHGRGVPRQLFLRQRDRATLADTPLIGSLTPHKLFRRQFLIDHGLRFPEGRRRLEDHVFVVQAYFAADVISVLADYDCYHHYARPDRSNAAARRLDPVGYYRNLREVLGIVKARTEAGPFQDSLLQRFARNELLNRLQGRAFLRSPQTYRSALFAEIGAVIREHIPESVDARLPHQDRTRMSLARAGRLDLLLAFAKAEARVVGWARLIELAWTPQSRLRIVAEAGMNFGRSPLRIERVVDGLVLGLPPSMAAIVPHSARRLESLLAATPVLIVRRRDDSAEIRIPATIEPHLIEAAEGRLDVVYSIDAELDPEALTGAPPRDATWDVIAALWFLGVLREAPLKVDRGSGQVGRARPGQARPPLVPFRTARGHLALAVGRRSWRLRIGDARRLAILLRRAWAARSVFGWPW